MSTAWRTSADAKRAALSAERSLMREADAYWAPATLWCQSCEEVEVEDGDYCDQCFRDRAEEDSLDEPGPRMWDEIAADDAGQPRTGEL
jgi:hypothetical protein